MAAVDLIIFGASGDLSARKLFPALFQLERLNLLEADLRIAAVARTQQTLDEFLPVLKEKMSSYMGDDAPSDEEWGSFITRFSYVSVNFSEPEQYGGLRTWLDDDRTSLFYFATPPSLFAPICEHLSDTRCLSGDCRIVVEKPIGENLASSIKVNETLAKYFDEKSIYRIDHYLGKETVQNLLVLRFANSFINSQWDNTCIDHVQITVGEMVGIEGRWSYYDKVGQLRDMVQNHLMQLMCLVAMEPPNSLSAESIRDEKVKIVRALRRIDSQSVNEKVVRGQYINGWVRGTAVPGYLDEDGCEMNSSNTETFVAIKAHIDNWRWSGVPFYLRTGKRLPEKVTEIVIQYKNLPHNIFGEGTTIPNKLVIRLQPNEGIELSMVSKKQSLKQRMSLQSHLLDLDFREGSDLDRIPDAYERLFLDAIQGDQSLFVGRDEIEESWRWCDGLIAACEDQAVPALPYQAGSWGPAKAEVLIEKDFRSWHA
ncbi:glucose-6-phosphate dehydrogenase [Luminiphilus sp.]|nr:glucose-6-phosphate dehydrogenase [Luminiphilus sp.]MDA8754590.1 glucose-6-phosphate dehydrogenase [Luminiphilus sp.]MDB2316926.1 glucose-6-phosphate dehydrogenase [Luminiphilus sp.]MDB2377976.1 glucose-6-phosphate dehydrogenase [Luminiphilus sp.]MDB2692415.1 glucose-6-phosphate dehydrogenase [Luminiphilus sp.]